MFHRHKNISVKSQEKPKVMLLGPLPPPYIGPATATQILINSKLTEEFTLYHCNTNTHIIINVKIVDKFIKKTYERLTPVVLKLLR